MAAATSSNPIAPARDHGFADPRVLMASRSLELRARVVVEGFWHGLHRSPHHGFSVEFTDTASTLPAKTPVTWIGGSTPAPTVTI